ncbi:3D domain-containing protein [Bdellovibrio svalbardensis]|uniref:3D domain-containing protein n=1 Tax=Bdellovibrio svalbardensis TaxID=2972972 RepID=A0ABT6DFX7_9BACT|nr:3D domain-containing protein [Bdellovibrio svalbardensis]MDG0814849.1 3D domain-containing protein [Bdellovibrio svalbardensis]
MKMLSAKFKNSVYFISLSALVTALTACGNLSAEISSTSPSVFQQQQKQEQQQQQQDQTQNEFLETMPLHDLGASEYQAFAEMEEPDALDEWFQAQQPSSEQTPKDEPTAEPKSTDSNPKVPTKPTEPEHQVAESGVIKPTVYYFPVFNEDKKLCDKDEVRTLHGTSGEKIINVCPSTLNSCGLQGSCAVIQKGVRRSFNISDRIRGQDRYFEMTNTECRYGYGVRSACLDPFYTVAADLDIYKPGDVIYVPAAVGLKLPDGTTHNGYFIVRDQGRGINGKGRFDFYSGFLSWRDSQNPFRKLRFEDMKTQVPYAKIIGAKAEQVLKSRAYPKLPMPPLK